MSAHSPYNAGFRLWAVIVITAVILIGFCLLSTLRTSEIGKLIAKVSTASVIIHAA
jgi:hypothetical protein